MSVPRGVSLCALKNESLPRWTQQRQKRKHLGNITTRVTVNVELVQLSPDVHIIRLTLKQLVLDGSHQTGTREVELDGEIRSIHFDRLAVGFVVYVLVSATKGGGIARCDEEVQILGRRRGEIDEPTKPVSLMTGPYARQEHTNLGFFFP